MCGIMAQQRKNPKRKIAGTIYNVAHRLACSTRGISYAARLSVFLCMNFLCFRPHFAISVKTGTRVRP